MPSRASVRAECFKPYARLYLSARRVQRYVTVATLISCTNLGTCTPVAEKVIARGFTADFFLRFGGRTTYPSDQGTRHSARTQTAEDMAKMEVNFLIPASIFATRLVFHWLDGCKSTKSIQRNAHNSVARAKMLRNV